MFFTNLKLALNSHSSYSFEVKFINWEKQSFPVYSIKIIFSEFLVSNLERGIINPAFGYEKC